MNYATAEVFGNLVDQLITTEDLGAYLAEVISTRRALKRTKAAIVV
jgi:hypothetical protein